MSRLSKLGHRLYTGEVSYDFIGHRRRWYVVSAVLLTICVVAVFGRGLNWGIEFVGGADFKATTAVTEATIPDMRAALDASGVPDLDESTINTIGSNQVRVQTRTLDPVDEVPKVRSAIAEQAGIPSEQVAYSLIGGSWGGQITDRALIALGVFLALVSLVIWAYFRNWKMSLAALVALLHDLVLTIGVYALVGFTVTPATVIGVLTILGYSLYDTVVVFDKVRENTRDLTSSARRTYAEAANLAVNQVLVRSINTTVIGVLPVAALLFAGAFILGEGPLKDLALALFVGMISGAYSSIFIATPLLAQLKEREPDLQRLIHRVESRRIKERPAAAAAQPATTVPPGEPVAGVVESEKSSDQEPTDEELAASGVSGSGSTSAELAGHAGRTRITVTSAPPVVGPTRTVSDGAAKRPQPQHRPRSQRRK